MNTFKLISIAFFCVYTACATAHRPLSKSHSQAVTMPVGQGHKIQSTSVTAISPTSLTSWELSGAVAARNRKRGWTATLNWLQKGPNQYQIRLFGPLGGGTVIIEKRGTVVLFRDGPKRAISNNADELLQKKTGVRLPVKNLYYWIRGLPAPGATQSERRDAHHYLISFNQAGYRINYTAYASINGMSLPSKIRLEGHGLLIKLAIKQWKVSLDRRPDHYVPRLVRGIQY